MNASFDIQPAAPMLDQEIDVQIGGLPPGHQVRVEARSERLQTHAEATFLADHHGVVDFAVAAPLSGTYQGVDPMGMFWSAAFDPHADLLAMFRTLGTLQPVDYTLTANVDGHEVARARVSQAILSDRVVHQAVRERRLRGTLFAPAAARTRPAVIVLSGSDGGNNFEFVSALLAAHGFVALSLAYFGFDDLPAELIEIPLEYFGEAVEWLRSRPEVGSAPIAVLGMSRGAELALLLGAHFLEIAAVVALSPSGVALPGLGRDPTTVRSAWTWRGEPIPFLPPPTDISGSMKAMQAAIASGTPLAMTPWFLRGLETSRSVAQAEIPVERTRGPILMISGEDDQVWPATTLAEIAVRRLRDASFGYPFEHVSYPDAGHMACIPPYLPTTRNWSMHPQVPLPLAYGGTSHATANASEDGWRRVLAFLQRHLV